jgi:hypothetical protein
LTPGSTGIMLKTLNAPSSDEIAVVTYLLCVDVATG